MNIKKFKRKKETATFPSQKNVKMKLLREQGNREIRKRGWIAMGRSKETD